MPNQVTLFNIMKAEKFSGKDEKSTLIKKQKKRTDKIISFLIYIVFLRVLYFLVPWYITLVLKYLDPDNIFLPTIFLMTSLISTEICSNVMFGSLYCLEIPYFEKKKCSNEPWPWKTDQEKWRKDFKKILLGFFQIKLFFVPLFIFVFSYFAPFFKITLDDIPSFPVFCFQVTLKYILDDFGMYWQHRLMHLPFFYKFHKKHHEIIIPITIADTHLHFVDFLTNVIATCVITQMAFGTNFPLISHVASGVLATWSAEEIHSGYEFDWSLANALPLSVTPKYHDDHHSRNLGNYGVHFQLWDKIFKSGQSETPIEDFSTKK